LTTVAEKTELTGGLLDRLGEAVHQLQRERGCAGLFLDSLGKIFARQYDTQNSRVDDAVAEVRNFLVRDEVKNALPEGFFSGRLAPLVGKFEQLGQTRDKIRLLAYRYTQALNTYTFTFTIPTIDAMIELAQRQEGYDSRLVSAYSNFLQWKERLGMERALGARGFHTYSFRNQEFCDRFVALIAEQKAYFETFKALASPAQIQIVEEHIESGDLDALAEVNSLLEDGAPLGEIEKYSGEAWFDLLTRMIEGLREAEQKLVAGLVRPTTKPAPQPETAGRQKGANALITQYRPFLKSLPMLAAIDDRELDELLSFAQIREYEKDKLLFLRDEPATRLYVVLQGWVKVYNGLETGEEAILQMLGSGETLLEAAVFLDVPTPVSAQVVENALLLSIPAPVIRQRIQSNPQLAVSMLNTVSLRSQRLVQQLELSRLKTVQERVGWFLLRLALSQRTPDGTIFLPYEKSIIASYLDMRPETFSRTLQKFKQEGFEVSSDYVKAPDPYALCSFCDVELATQCVRASTEECPHPELSDISYRNET